MSAERPDASARNRLFVEGSDDLYVVIELVKAHGIAWTGSDGRIPYAPRSEGHPGALRRAEAAVKGQSERVGLIVDGDEDPAARWAEVCRGFAAKLEPEELDALALPATYPAGGFVGSPRQGHWLGIWIMPDGRQPGAIESFVQPLLPGDRLWDHAIHATLEARQHGAGFADKDRLKAQLRTWLAWQAQPGVPYGQAIRSGYLRHDSPAAAALVDWFRRVYGLTTDPPPQG